VEGSGTGVGGRRGAKGDGPHHMVKWRTDGRGGSGREVDTTGREPHASTTPFRTPPPPSIKGRMVEGVRNRLSVIDLGTSILTV
jgi:hypothetical protein